MFIDSVRLSSYVPPILLPHIFVNFDGAATPVQRIATGAFRARNPIVFTRIDIVVIGLETGALEALKSLTAIVQSAPRL